MHSKNLDLETKVLLKRLDLLNDAEFYDLFENRRSKLFANGVER